MYRDGGTSGNPRRGIMAHTVKGYKGVGMEGPIARWYATSTAKDRGRHEDQARSAIERTPNGGTILEVAPGPGYTSIALAKTGDYAVTGLDISSTFVAIARHNAAEAGVHVDFRQGNASAMPFDDETFDFIMCCAAFKNFAEPGRALREMCRVLRPGGRALIIDLRRDVSKQAVAEEVAQMGLNTVASAITKFVLGSWLPRRAYTKKQFTGFFADTDFGSFEIVENGLTLQIDMHR
jgi:ubiquinone/menaquinone biosynthesis C-methylase UbiE